MIAIRQILCPVDRSAGSRRAAAYAGRLAKYYDAALTVIEVTSTPIVPAPISPTPEIGVVVPDQREAIEGELSAIAAPIRATGVPVTVVVERGPVVRHILGCAERLGADLLVMGTHGHGGVERFVLGSVTEKVLRKARCPVMVIPPESAESPATPDAFRTIVCGVDFSPASTEALEYALSLAQEHAARLIAVHVLDWPRDAHTGGVQGTLAAARHDAEADALDRLQKAIPAEARDWCRPEAIVTEGRPWERLLDVAREQAADLIVLGVHGRTTFDVLLFGSTTSHVARAAACPVLTVGRRGTG